MLSLRTAARAAWVCAALIGAPVAGAAAATPQPIDFSTYRPSTPATRIETSEAPKIDGDLSDAVWQKAPIIDQFYQIEPDAGKPARQRTVARVLYDKNAIYVSFYCYDDDPKHIPSGAKARDANVSNGDIVRLYLDPGMTRRNGYAFEVNPLGGRVDAIIQNNSDYLADWNTIWAAKVKTVSDGWTVEIMVPFRSISYNAKSTDWGFDLYRLMRRDFERVRWTSAIGSIPSLDISRSGTLTGVHDVTQGMGLDIQTYASLRFKHEWTHPSETDVKGAASGNLFYKITPALTGTLTLNPDFSNTPLDQRKINTSRFALFFPETRDFFLQDVAAFEFGGVPFNSNVGDPNGMPFFSRNVGLVNGVPVPINIGTKLSGMIDDFNVGAFSAQADGLGDNQKHYLSVVRVSHPILDESKVGFIYTNGDPSGQTRNSVIGTDFQYRTSHFNGAHVLNVHGAYLHSMSSAVGGDDEFAVGIDYPNEPWSGHLVYREIGANFTPALGYVNRTGIRDLVFNPERFVRITHPFFRWYDYGTYQEIVTGLDNRMQSYFGDIYVGAQSLAGDQAFLNFNRDVEVVPSAFTIADGAVVNPGTYRWNFFRLNFNSSYKRKWQLEAHVSCCDFYNGQATQLDFTLNYRPNATWEISPEYVAAIIDLPTGSTSIYVGILNVNVNFTPDMQIRTQVQYDNISQIFDFAIRYRWEYQPGSELFAAIGEEALITDRLWESHYASQTTQASFRLGHTFRF